MITRFVKLFMVYFGKYLKIIFNHKKRGAFTLRLVFLTDINFTFFPVYEPYTKTVFFAEDFSDQLFPQHDFKNIAKFFDWHFLSSELFSYHYTYYITPIAYCQAVIRMLCDILAMENSYDPFSLNEIQKRLRAVIKESGKPQKEIAKNIRVSQATLSDYMHRNKFPALDTLARLCDFLDVSPEDILGTRK